MKQYFIGIFTTVCLTASVFMPMDSKNMNDKIDIDFINMQKTIDLTVAKDSKCSLHSKEMSKTVINIFYGLPPSWVFEEMKMIQISFPNGRARLLGRWKDEGLHRGHLPGIRVLVLPQYGGHK